MPTLHMLQTLSLLGIAVLLFASRNAHGKARPIHDGIAFPLKPLVIWSRALALVMYCALFAYPLWISQRSIPAWLLVLLFAATMFGLYQLPGTIVLTSSAIIQRFWLRDAKQIPYTDVMATHLLLRGRQTRVLGANRVTITHTYNHSAAAEFQRELEARTGKRLTR